MANKDGTWRDVAERVRNWGRWGDTDELGTLNFITQEEIRASAGLVQQGKVFSLGIPIDEHGPQGAHGYRRNPFYTMTFVGASVEDLPSFAGRGGSTEAETVALINSGPMRFNDDYIAMHLQASTQWDALAHIFYDNHLYNGYPSSAVTTLGATRDSIDVVAAAGRIVARGVLLDVARHRKVNYLTPDATILPDELDETAAAQGVAIRRGDVVVVRTGWRSRFLETGDGKAWRADWPGLDWRCAEWLHAKEAAAVASDNLAVEGHNQDADVPFVFHMLTLRDMGLMLGELWDLEALGADCAEDGVYEFQLVAQPLQVTGGVGSPINPLALK
jgi:kynurenine formamidase